MQAIDIFESTYSNVSVQVKVRSSLGLAFPAVSVQLFQLDLRIFYRSPVSYVIQSMWNVQLFFAVTVSSSAVEVVQLKVHAWSFICSFVRSNVEAMSRQ